MNEHEGGESEAQPARRPLGPFLAEGVASLAAHATALIAVAAAAWFGILSFGATLAYSPIGVAPSEVGLDSATVLGQAAISVVVLNLATVVVAFLYVATLGRWFPSQKHVDWMRRHRLIVKRAPSAAT